MSSPSAFQCLFCNHLNPAGASFCNECGSQLQLQQCDLCGSINKRSARVCYKCGAALAVHPSYAGAQLLPPRLGAGSDCVDGGAAADDTTLAESLARALDAARGEPGVARTNSGNPRNPVWPRAGLDLADAQPVLPASVATERRSATRHPLLLLLLLLVVAVAFHFLPWSSWSMALRTAVAGGERESAPRLPTLTAPAGQAGQAAIGSGQRPPRALAGDAALPAAVPAVVPFTGARTAAADAGKSAAALPERSACADAVAALGLCAVPNKE